MLNTRIDPFSKFYTATESFKLFVFTYQVLALRISESTSIPDNIRKKFDSIPTQTGIEIQYLQPVINQMMMECPILKDQTDEYYQTWHNRFELGNKIIGEISKAIYSIKDIEATHSQGQSDVKISSIFSQSSQRAITSNPTQPLQANAANLSNYSDPFPSDTKNAYAVVLVNFKLLIAMYKKLKFASVPKVNLTHASIQIKSTISEIENDLNQRGIGIFDLLQDPSSEIKTPFTNNDSKESYIAWNNKFLSTIEKLEKVISSCATPDNKELTFAYNNLLAIYIRLLKNYPSELKQVLRKDHPDLWNSITFVNGVPMIRHAFADNILPGDATKEWMNCLKREFIFSHHNNAIEISKNLVTNTRSEVIAIASPANEITGTQIEITETVTQPTRERVPPIENSDQTKKEMKLVDYKNEIKTLDLHLPPKTQIQGPIKHHERMSYAKNVLIAKLEDIFKEMQQSENPIDEAFVNELIQQAADKLREFNKSSMQSGPNVDFVPLKNSQIDVENEKRNRKQPEIVKDFLNEAAKLQVTWLTNKGKASLKYSECEKKTLAPSQRKKEYLPPGNRLKLTSLGVPSLFSKFSTKSTDKYMEQVEREMAEREIKRRRIENANASAKLNPIKDRSNFGSHALFVEPKTVDLNNDKDRKTRSRVLAKLVKKFNPNSREELQIKSKIKGNRIDANNLKDCLLRALKVATTCKFSDDKKIITISFNSDDDFNQFAKWQKTMNEKKEEKKIQRLEQSSLGRR